MSMIHPQAIIEPGAKIGHNVEIEPFAVIKKTVTIEDNVVIKSHAYIDGYTTIREGTIIWPGASIGTKTQDLKYQGEKTFVEIGKHCEIREFTTINSSCQENSVVKVGENSLIMAYCHIAHNCQVGSNVIMANNSALAGHVTVDDYAIIGGMTPIHQFCRIGKHAMVGGFSRIACDIPPYTVGGGIPYRFGGINLIGLKRRAFSLEVRKYLTQAFKITYRMNLHLEEAIALIKKELPPIEEIQYWINFCLSSKRGLEGLQGVTKQVHDDDQNCLEEEEKILLKQM